ncbi:cryptochrome/photolyase family protein [Serinibacter arcticus]|uniref:Deoxyribodipyrimidine photolyase n=1 Tax=Serinibacter arcticus TaxID=1655435 RepID=A0A4Z1E3K7_9MICO|nr:deoxyribodipyrimidine photo-lyase [Serinibacter arcticus]TGO05850.1 Deoxyribodipyrimidine photolyase [Serinibacter arcticus]
MPRSAPNIWWVRRDLRLHDNPALLAATGEHLTGEAGKHPVLAVFVIDDALMGPAGKPRHDYLMTSLARLDAAIGGSLLLVHGTPENVLPQLATTIGAAGVHIATDYGPYGSQRDERVAEALGDVELVRSGSPYAVAPGRVTKDDGSPYKVYTPFGRAWEKHGWRDAAPFPAHVTWVDPDDVDLGRLVRRDLPDPAEGHPRAGEEAARKRWEEFRTDAVAEYGTERDRPDHEGTSQLSAALKWGELHPRTLLADLARKRTDGAAVFRSELAWREFYADVLWQDPASARESLRDVVADDVWIGGDDERHALDAWAAGRTGYPFVDAGMRQLAETGWMHNRVRMVVASFLVKDLHVRWQAGARHFMLHLVDGDLASNSHNWQWVAGTGTDAAPFFRIFNPVTQGVKFDPQGDYVRRWVPELRGVTGKAVHEPWKLDAQPAGYPERMIDHKQEREVTLEAYGRR